MSIALTSSANEPDTISVSGLRNRTYRARTVASPRLLAWANPRFSTHSTRACGKSRPTRAAEPSVDPLSTTTTSRVAPPAWLYTECRQGPSQRAELCDTMTTASSATLRCLPAHRLPGYWPDGQSGRGKPPGRASPRRAPAPKVGADAPDVRLHRRSLRRPHRPRPGAAAAARRGREPADDVGRAPRAVQLHQPRAGRPGGERLRPPDRGPLHDQHAARPGRGRAQRHARHLRRAGARA